MRPRPKGYPYHTLIATYRSWGHDPGLEACLTGRRTGGFGGFVRLVLKLKKQEICTFIGDYDRAFGLCREALDHARVSGMPLGRAWALSGLSGIYVRKSDYGPLKEVAEEALQIYSAFRNERGQAEALFNLGYRHSCLGELERAKELFERALRLYEAVGDREEYLSCLISVATMCADTGGLGAALEKLQQALALAEEIQDRVSQAACWYSLGALYFRKGDWASCSECQGRALALYQTIGERSGLAWALTNAGALEGKLGNFQKALARFKEAFRLFQSLAEPYGQAMVLAQVGFAHEALGNWDQAAEGLKRAVAIRQELGERREQVLCLSALVRVFLHQGDFAQAGETLSLAQEIVSAGTFDQEVLCRVHYSVAALALEAGDLEQAGRDVERGLALAEGPDFSRHRALLLLLRARLRWKQGEERASLADQAEAVSLLSLLDEKAELAMGHYHFGRTLLSHGVEDKGRWYLGEARRTFEAIGANGWLNEMEAPER